MESKTKLLNTKEVAQAPRGLSADQSRQEYEGQRGSL